MILFSFCQGTETIEGMIIHSRMLKNVHFSTKLFSRMVKLRILKIDGELHLKGSFKYLSSDLRLFSWRNCQLRHIPSSFRLQKLVYLDMQGSNIEEFQPRLQVRCIIYYYTKSTTLIRRT